MNEFVDRARRLADVGSSLQPEYYVERAQPLLRPLADAVEYLTHDRDAMQRRAEAAECDWQKAIARNAQLQGMLFQAKQYGTVGSKTYHAMKALDLSQLYDVLDAEPPAVEVAIMERAIERMGWPEIDAFEAELRRGQSIDEDAGGFLMRCIRRLFGLPARDSVVTYQQAARALLAEHPKWTEPPPPPSPPQPDVPYKRGA